MTCALSFFDSETYPRLEIFRFDAAATRVAGEVRSSREDDEAACFRHKREACRNEEEAMFDMFGG